MIEDMCMTQAPPQRSTWAWPAGTERMYFKTSLIPQPSHMSYKLHADFGVVIYRRDPHGAVIPI